MKFTLFLTTCQPSELLLWITSQVPLTFSSVWILPPELCGAWPAQLHTVVLSTLLNWLSTSQNSFLIVKSISCYVPTVPRMQPLLKGNHAFLSCGVEEDFVGTQPLSFPQTTCVSHSKIHLLLLSLPSVVIEGLFSFALSSCFFFSLYRETWSVFSNFFSLTMITAFFPELCSSSSTLICGH